VLKGIPAPKSFSPSRVPNEELVTDRYQVGAQTAGTVACLWLRQWMPKGYFEWDGHKRDLLPEAEGLGCADKGLPLLPKRMKIQRDRGGPPAPR
jgi:hypothetical protein